MLSIRRIVGLLIVFSILGRARPAPVQDVSGSNSTTKSASEFEPTWVSGPQRRGTLIILFSCVLTLILCVWTTVHSNLEPELWDEDDDEVENGIANTRIPKQQAPILGFAARVFKDGEEQGRGGPFRKFARLFRGGDEDKAGGKDMIKIKGLDKNKGIWSIATLLFPEITLCIAAHERRTAILLRNEMRRLHAGHYQHWNTTLGYYAVMGGIVVKKTGGDNEQPVVEEVRSERPGLEKDGDVIVGTGSPEPELPERKPEKWDYHRRTLTPRGVFRLACLGKLPLWIKPQTVKDKNKASILAKFLVCFQAIWIIVQVLGRYIEGLPVTLLELYTVLHTMCAVAMYVIWMEKPFDIRQPSVIHLSASDLDLLLKPEAANANQLGVDVFWNHGYPHCLTQRAGLGKLLFRQLWNWEEYKEAETLLQRLYPLLSAYVALWNGMNHFLVETLALSFVGFAYGGLHLLAWNYQFPSSSEHTIWKVASVWTAGTVCGFCFTIPGGYIGMLIWAKIEEKRKGDEERRGSEADVKRPGLRRTSRLPLLPGHFSMSRTVRAVTDFLLKNVTDQFFAWFLYFFVIGFLLAIIPAFLARLFLLVESFIAMRRLQVGSYDVVQWGNFMPHFG